MEVRSSRGRDNREESRLKRLNRPDPRYSLFPGALKIDPRSTWFPIKAYAEGPVFLGPTSTPPRISFRTWRWRILDIPGLEGLQWRLSGNLERILRECLEIGDD